MISKPHRKVISARVPGTGKRRAVSACHFSMARNAPITTAQSSGVFSLYVRKRIPAEKSGGPPFSRDGGINNKGVTQDGKRNH
jgi:hypothetical protein